jgi:hypothetical protein
MEVVVEGSPHTAGVAFAKRAARIGGWVATSQSSGLSAAGGTEERTITSCIGLSRISSAGR